MSLIKSRLVGSAVTGRTRSKTAVIPVDTPDTVHVQVNVEPANNGPVYFSKKNETETSRIPINSLIGKGVSFLSCDEKDIFINPWNLSNALSRITTPALSSMTPITVNYAADGFPRVEGKPWNGGKDTTESETAPDYDPSDPSTLVSYGLVADRETGKLPFPVLGFRIQCRIFDTDMGASTLGLRVFSRDYDHEVINALLSVDAPEAEVIVPFFEENIVRSTAGSGEWTKDDDATIKFFASKGVRDGSYNLVFAPPVDSAATIADLPSFFTVTGQNVYTYVSPIMGTDRSVSALLDTLSKNPRGYLLALQNLTK